MGRSTHTTDSGEHDLTSNSGLDVPACLLVPNHKGAEVMAAACNNADDCQTGCTGKEARRVPTV